MTVVLSIYKLAQLVLAGILPDLQTALKIKSAIEGLGPEFKVNVHALADAADKANQDEIEKVNAWLQANGYDPVPPDALTAK